MSFEVNCLRTRSIFSSFYSFLASKTTEIINLFSSFYLSISWSFSSPCECKGWSCLCSLLFFLSHGHELAPSRSTCARESSYSSSFSFFFSRILWMQMKHTDNLPLVQCVWVVTFFPLARKVRYFIFTCDLFFHTQSIWRSCMRRCIHLK